MMVGSAVPINRSARHTLPRVSTVPDGRGQATVELALVLPFVFIVLLVGVDIALISRDAIRVEHAARQAARVASVEGDATAATVAAKRALDANANVSLSIGPPGGDVSATVTLLIAEHLSIVGRLRPDLSVSATIHLRREGDTG
jgi:Flp pilus assembly protein TadG